MKALVIAGGLPQIELIKQLKERGIEALLADGSACAVARPYADKFFHVDVFNIEAIKQIAVSEKVDFLITVCADQVLLVVAEVSEMLGLPCYIDFETGMNVSDKIRMKRIFKKGGVPTTDYIETDQLDKDAIAHLKYPLVVKPVDAYSSKGVRKAENEVELRLYYEEAHKISRSGGVIVEEFFSGEEVSVDAFVVNGKAVILNVSSSEKVRDKDRFVIFRGHYPAKVSEKVMKKIEDVVQKIVDVFELVNAPLLVQLLNNGDEISVLEFCARTGGQMKYLLIKYASGVDVIGATIDITLGKKPDLSQKAPTHNVVVNDFVYCNPGTFDHFEGFEELKAAGVINELFPVRQKGTYMHGVMNSSDRIAGINVVADTLSEYNEKLMRINNTVMVMDDKGNDIMRHDLLPELH